MGDAEAPLVVRVRLLGESADGRVDDHAKAEPGLVRIARVVADLDREDPQRNVDLWRGKAGPACGSHRLDQVGADAMEVVRAQFVVAHLPGAPAQRGMADLHDPRGRSRGQPTAHGDSFSLSNGFVRVGVARTPGGILARPPSPLGEEAPRPVAGEVQRAPAVAVQRAGRRAEQGRRREARAATRRSPERRRR